VEKVEGDEDFDIQATNVLPSTTIDDQSATVFLRIPRGTSPKSLIEINHLLQSNKGGDRQMVILVENGFGEKKINLPYHISWNNELESRINLLLSSAS